MQIAARLLMTAAAAAVNAVAGAANEAAADAAAPPAADASSGFGALLSAALSPDTAAGNLALPGGAGTEAGIGAGTTEQDKSGLPAEPSPTPDLMLQALLMASQATATPVAVPAPPADAAALPTGLRTRSVDAALPTAATSPDAFDKVAGRNETPFDAPGLPPLGPAALAGTGAGAAAGQTAQATQTIPPTPPFAETMRHAEREPEMSAGATAAIAYAPAATELPATQTVRHVSAPLSSARWEQALGEQVLWVARKDMQTASLTLNPPELGPVRVELHLNDTQAIASFSSQQPEVRKAIEDALPSLKALFADAGLQLQHANVGSGDAGQQAGQQAARHRQVEAGDGVTAHDADEAPASMAAGLPARASNRLLDTFA